jgi:transposase-like protein/IS1 family transposase
VPRLGLPSLPGPKTAQPKPYGVSKPIIRLLASAIKGGRSVTCHNCRIECKKAGRRPDGTQRYRCSQCSKTFSHHKEYGIIGHKQAVSEEKAVLALKLLVEGNRIRSAQRISGLNQKTIMSLLEIAGERCEALFARFQNVRASDVQADEIWSFVAKKQAHVGPGDEGNVGDAWCFIAIERSTKMILAFEVGKRTVSSATRFVTKLANATDPERHFQLTTDGLNAYPTPVGDILGDRVDYAQLIKIYAQGTVEEERRYSPPRLAEGSKDSGVRKPE